MTAPAAVYERIARAWKRGGGPVVSVVSRCTTERGARRVAAKHPGAEIEETPDGWVVWTVRRG